MKNLVKVNLKFEFGSEFPYSRNFEFCDTVFGPTFEYLCFVILQMIKTLSLPTKLEKRVFKDENPEEAKLFENIKKIKQNKK